MHRKMIPVLSSGFSGYLHLSNGTLLVTFTVHENDGIARGVRTPRGQRRLLAEVARQLNDPDLRIPVTPGEQCLNRGIFRAVIDE